MRYLRYAFLTILGLVLFVLAISNREFVTLRMLPDDSAALLGMPNQLELPLFIVILAALVGGILVGLVLEWFREHHIRAEAARRGREAASLKRDLAAVRKENTPKADDDVLAILDGVK